MRASPDIQELVSDSRFIFSGTVVELGSSSVPNLPPRSNFALVRIDHPLRSDPALGNLRGKLVTVALHDRGELRPAEKVVFFTLDWIQGGGIAVRELAHVDVVREEEVAKEVARLPERHLANRLADAILVVIADVTEIRPTPFDIRWRDAPQWAAATLRILKVLRGQPIQIPTALFPTSGRPLWARSPRLKRGQRSIFLLHLPSDWPPLPESGETPLLAFTLLDEADVQPESQLALVEKLLGQGGIR